MSSFTSSFLPYFFVSSYSLSLSLTSFSAPSSSASVSPPSSLTSFSGLPSPRPDGEVVNDLLDLLQVVLDRVELLPQVVVLQVEQPEAGVEAVEEGGDTAWPGVILAGHAVHGEAGQLVAEVAEAQQVLL